MNRLDSVGALALLAVATLAGCLSGTPDDLDDPGDGECIENGDDCAARPRLALIHLKDCRDALFVIELREEVYELPPPFINSATASSPQRLAVSLVECNGVANDTEPVFPESFVQVGVLVEPVGRGPEAEAEVFTIETTVGPAEAFPSLRQAGFHTLNGTVKIDDMLAFRSAEAIGDVAYSVDGQFVPWGDGDTLSSPVILSTVLHHNLDGWYLEKRWCQVYFGSALIELTATRGVLVEAMPAVGPLIGTAGQGFSCNATLVPELAT